MNLGTMAFQHTSRDSQYFLIDKPELRDTYGHLIGQIAWSHWQNLEEVAKDFDGTLGSYPGFPNDWTIDPLKIACLRRVCDACHVDARRAPAFLAALKKPHGSAELHGRFQAFIQTPFVKHGRMHFTSTKPFPVEDREAWWLGYDLLREADRELSEVDSLLGETGRPVLKAHGVANVQSPQRLARDLKTEGWTPVDTAVRITDVAKIVQTLGGGHLYGRNSTVPLRELIQNARDAVVARRIQERREADWGSIRARLLHQGEEYWLEVEDNGLGMSEGVLCGPLIDFGESYWDSDRVAQEWPGLLAAGFQPVGKYGIGFFSVFMIGEHVTIATRRPKDGKPDTRVLEFEQGLEARPILRPATAAEQRNEPGSLVRVLLTAKPTDRDGILGPMNFDEGPFDRVRRDKPWEIKELCEWLCPALDVDLFVAHDQVEQLAIKADDWRTIEPRKLVERTILDRDEKDRILNSPLMTSLLASIRPVRDSENQMIGRACLWPEINFQEEYTTTADFQSRRVVWGTEGMVTCGPFRSSRAQKAIGLWIGRPTLAARNDACAVAIDYPLQLMEWATEQADLLAERDLDLIQAEQAATMIRSIGADTGRLPIAFNETGFLDFPTLCAMDDLGPEVVIFPTDWSDRMWFVEPDRQQKANPDRHVLPNSLGVLSPRMRGGLLRGYRRNEDPKQRASHAAWKRFWMSLWGATMEAVATAWGVSLDEMLAVSDICTKTKFFNAPVGVDAEGKEIRSVEVDILRRPI